MSALDFEKAAQFFERALDNCVMVAKQPFALAVKALHEVAMQRVGCPRCTYGKAFVAVGGVKLFVGADGSFDVISEDVDHRVEIKLPAYTFTKCPWCGKLLKKDDVDV